MRPFIPPFRRRARGVSPAVGLVLVIAIVAMLATTVAVMALGFTTNLDAVDPVEVAHHDGCAYDTTVEFDGDFDRFHDQLTDNPCTLWLDAEVAETDAAGNVKRWPDGGPNGFDAAQADAGTRPELVDGASAPGGIDAPVVNFENNASLRPGCSPGDGDGCHSQPGDGIRYYDEGDSLRIDRNPDQLGVDEDTGMAVAAVLYTESFDRGGTWTIGEAGASGREFSMRTCGADRTWGGCGHVGSPVDPTDHWRGQHWQRADVDFSAPSQGQWIVLIHAYDGEETTIRVDGTEVARERTDLDLSQNRDVQIGRWQRTSGDPDFYYDGAVAELLVFDRAMSDEELSEVEDYFDARYDAVNT